MMLPSVLISTSAPHGLKVKCWCGTTWSIFPSLFFFYVGVFEVVGLYSSSWVPDLRCSLLVSFFVSPWSSLLPDTFNLWWTKQRGLWSLCSAWNVTLKGQKCLLKEQGKASRRREQRRSETHKDQPLQRPTRKRIKEEKNWLCGVTSAFYFNTCGVDVNLNTDGSILASATCHGLTVD